MTQRLVGALVFVAMLVGGVGATQQSADPPPAISQAQQDQFTIAALAKENAILKAQQAAADFDRVVASLQRTGFLLQQNRETGKLEYVKAPEKKDP